MAIVCVRAALEPRKGLPAAGTDDSGTRAGQYLSDAEPVCIGRASVGLLVYSSLLQQRKM